MNKYAYFTLCTKNEYINQVRVLWESYKRQKCKYPFYVLITENINWPFPQINTVCIKKFSFEKGFERYKDTVNKFYIFKQIEFNKIFFLDADIIITENLDKYFDYCDYSFYGVKSKKFVDKDVSWAGGYFIIQPSPTIFKYVLDNYKKYDDDEYILKELFPYYENRDLSCLDKSFFSKVKHLPGVLFKSAEFLTDDPKKINILLSNLSTKDFETLILLLTEAVKKYDNEIKHINNIHPSIYMFESEKIYEVPM